MNASQILEYPDGRMNTENAARYLGVTLKTLAMWRCAGTGPAFVKRGRIFYYRSDLDTWLRGGRAQSTAQARQNNARLQTKQQAELSAGA
ncbi:MAG: helix-turn-helix domain-containing protein [Gammaproteobacteria bacterium]